MLGHSRVLILGCHFDEPVRVSVGLGPETTLFLRPVAESVPIEPGADLLAERPHGEDGFGAGGRTALNRGARNLRPWEGREGYPVFRHDEASEHLSAQSAASFAGRGHQRLFGGD